MIWQKKTKNVSETLLGKCPDTKFFLVRIFFYSDWIQSKSPYSVRVQENTDQKKLHFWTIFTQWNDKFSLLLVQLKQWKKAKTGKPTYQIDYNFLMQNLFFVKNFIKLSIQFHRLQLSLLSLFMLILLYIR